MDSTHLSSAKQNITQVEWLEYLMDTYGDALTKLSYSYIKDIGKAQEIVQDVFLLCYERFEELQQITSLKAWLYKVTINRSKDKLRSGWMKRVILNNFIPAYTKAPNSTEQAFIRQEEHHDLLMLVLNLPIKYRETLLLFYYEDLSIAEISFMLQLNENTVKTRLKRARELLKQLVKDGDFSG
ncbi:sigma-70 family RNA polymerase sigma factor [Lysinibacillus sp. 3P01SB]|uniref:sigma-70 family RNA polymerase sigma factor n=1 Tax=Lysinibacillus sp. 3P01SB TaxID=3132284 RepID=UPI0039A561D1